jgi:hypothetical protein
LHTEAVSVVLAFKDCLLDELAGGGVESEDEGSSRSVQDTSCAVDAIEVESRRDDSVTAVVNSIAKVVT